MNKFTLWLFSFFAFFLILSTLAAMSLPDGKLPALGEDSGNSNYSFVISRLSPIHSIFTSQIFHSSFDEFFWNAFVLSFLCLFFWRCRKPLSGLFQSFYQFLAVFALPFLFASFLIWLLLHSVPQGDIVGMSILNFSLIGVFFAFSLFCIVNKIDLKVILSNRSLAILFVLLAYVFYSLVMVSDDLTFLAHLSGLVCGFISCFLFFRYRSR